MDVRLRIAARWALVLVVFSATSFLLFALLMGLMLWPDRPLVVVSTALGIAPRATIEAAHRLNLFLAILIWVVPTTGAIGFALHKSQRNALSVALPISVLFFATVCFFLDGRDHSGSMKSVAITAAVIVLSGLAFSFASSKFSRFLTPANFLALLLLFSPSMWALSHKTVSLPQPKQLWSATLQQEQWQSMNTASEYAATRQVAFAGDRVIAVFNSGFALSQPSKDKWPLSNYQLVSLDLKTGAKRNEITFPGRWGSMPYIYATHDDLISVQSNPPHILNPDLTSAANPTNVTLANASAIQRLPGCGTSCDDPTSALTDSTFVQLQQKEFQVLDDRGHILNRGDLVEWGRFAGASADGHRFAIQSSYTEGDPDFVVYEYFTIYDAATGKALATVHIKDLPDRESWSAFSPDGRYFVAGNPNKLTMYELP
jgi:hypothetical protein